MNEMQNIRAHLDFGSDVAENDPILEKYFIETTDFTEILSGKYDIIRGAKGSGKSSIYKIICGESFKKGNTIIIPASEATSSQIFRDTQEKAKTEDQFRLLWTAYISSVVSNELLQRFSSEIKSSKCLQEIEQFISAISLKKESKSLLSSLKKTAKSAGIGLSATESGMPSLEFKVEFGETNDDRLPLSEDHFLELLKLCTEVLKQKGLSVWVAMDRLDELFMKGSENELAGLRGLFRSHLNVCAINNGQFEIRCKIFMRTDIYDKITRETGFTNVTHFRDLNIVWNMKSILALIVRRITSNKDILESLYHLRVPITDPNAVWDILLPDRIQRDKSLAWISKATTDASSAYNPRNFITLLNLSARKTNQLIKNNQHTPVMSHAISPDAILSSFGELSRKRLDDTVLAEFPSVRPLIELLKGKSNSYESLSALGKALDDNDTASLEKKATLLADAGVLKRITASSFAIAYLYRPALRAGNADRSASTAIE